MAQGSAIGVGVAATPPCSAIRFRKEIFMRHLWHFQCDPPPAQSYASPEHSEHNCDRGVGKKVRHGFRASFPYSIGSGLPSHLQEPWAALIDSGAVTSIAPSSFAPHVPITPHSGQLVNVNGGEIKIKGQKKVTYVTHMVVMHITFLIVEDVLNPIIGLDALHQNSVQFHLFQNGKAYLQQKSQKTVLHYHKHHYYASGLVLSGFVKSSILKWGCSATFLQHL